jgi:hypothetical protein
MSRHQISVYPDPDAVDALGGRHSSLLSQAIESLSALHSFAIANLDKVLDRADWNFLAEVLKDTSLKPSSTNLCQRLGEAVEDAAQRDSLVFAVYGDSTGKRPRSWRPRFAAWIFYMPDSLCGRSSGCGFTPGKLIQRCASGGRRRFGQPTHGATAKASANRCAGDSRIVWRCSHGHAGMALTSRRVRTSTTAFWD